MEKNKNNSGLKLLKNLAIFISIILVTFYIIFKDQDLSEIKDILLKIDLKYIFVGIIFMCIYFICDAINITRSLRCLGEKTSFVKNIKYSLIGFFFSSITPAASGGQPAQIYYMSKEKISVANSTLTFLINLTCMQIVTISTAFVSLAFNYKNMNSVIIGCFILGISLNIIALVLLLISIFSKRATNWMINFSIKVLKFFKVKNLEQKSEKIRLELEKYQSSAKDIKNNKKMIIKNILTTYVQFFFYFGISYFVYRSFGLSECNIFKIISLQSILFATVSGIPSPGAVGVSEGGFLQIFKSVYTKQQISGAMILNRGINFYLFVLISAIVVIITALFYKGKNTEINKEETI